MGDEVRGELGAQHHNVYGFVGDLGVLALTQIWIASGVGIQQRCVVI